MTALKTLLVKAPWGLLLIGYLVLQGYGFLMFMTDELNSPYLQKVKVLETENMRVSELERKKREAEEFMRSLESKRAELRAAAQELSQMKAVLAEDLDIAAFIKMLVTEAKRVNIRVQGIEPRGESPKLDASGKPAVYISQTFNFKFRGVFAQVVVFLERLLQAARIVSVDGYDFAPIQASAGRYAELEGNLQIKTYRYNRSVADDKADAASSTGSVQ